MELDVKDFKKKFPHLAEEIVAHSTHTLRKIQYNSEETLKDPLRGYTPTPEDYLRRCKDDKEAEKIIEYLREHGEITHEKAEKLRERIKERGICSFGSRKNDGYYVREHGEC